eukprot:502376-Amphidinium_carterae.1
MKPGFKKIKGSPGSGLAVNWRIEVPLLFRNLANRTPPLSLVLPVQVTSRLRNSISSVVCHVAHALLSSKEISYGVVVGVECIFGLLHVRLKLAQSTRCWKLALASSSVEIVRKKKMSSRIESSLIVVLTSLGAIPSRKKTQETNRGRKQHTTAHDLN